MGVRADGHPATRLRDHPEPVDVEILAVRVSIDLERRPGLRGAAGDALPVRAEARPEVVDAAARMREHVNVGVGERREISLRLILPETELGMERAEHEVEPRERGGIHVAGAFRREVHLDRSKGPGRHAPWR